jgi:pimeloyl-ACP methyl ester carboxylesterase
VLPQLLSLTLLAAPPPALAPCHLRGLREGVECGSVQVPARRGEGASPLLTVRFARIPARARAPLPDPLFLLLGGPGQAATDAAPLVPRFFERVALRRDVVLVDLRGTGGSHPLKCDLDPEYGAAFGAGLHACRASLPADLRPYTTEEQMRDLDAVRASLGYQRINLWGGSFGTRAGLVYARDHPERVRTIVLDGAVPFEHTFPVATARNTQQALLALLRDCERDPECAAAFPSLRKDLESVLSRLDRAPTRVEADDPVTGLSRSFRMDRLTFAAGLKLMLYTPQHSRLVPFAIARAAQADYRPLIAASEAGLAYTRDVMALGLTAQLGCAEDFARARQAGRLRADIPPDSLLGATDVESWARTCAQFAPVSADLSPRVIGAPALILSGGLDPVTPPEWGERMRAAFRDAAHVVVRAGFHNVSFAGCLPELIARFVDSGTAAGIDASCASRIQRPAFFVGGR